MRQVNTFLLLLFISFHVFGQESVSRLSHTYTIKINNKSYVRILGRTNVSTFECSYGSELSTATFQVGVFKGSNGATCFEDAVIQLRTESFDCGLREMTKDFQELLEEEKHPYMTMEIQCMTSDLLDFSPDLQSKVKFTIAGISNFYNINFETKTEDDKILCIGKKEINIEDFNIIPPTKLFGLVKVHNTITVVFHIILTLEEDTSMSAISGLQGG